MIFVDSIALTDEAQAGLDHYQLQVDSERGYKEKVEKAKSVFKRSNRKTNKTFSTVRDVLDQMCSGARRCHYCEDSAADEIEHFYPKDIYPEYCFAWSNYLYSCGACNGTYKNNKFKIFESTSRDIIDLTPPRRNRSYTPPPCGTPLLLDPRHVNPMDYIMLDFTTFMYAPIQDPGTEEYERGKYTIKLLGLNSRPVLVKSRMAARRNYIGRLDTYRLEKETASVDELEKMISELQTESHPTVWLEMKRQHEFYPELKKRFDEIPEALDW